MHARPNTNGHATMRVTHRTIDCYEYLSAAMDATAGPGRRDRYRFRSAYRRVDRMLAQIRLSLGTR